MFTFFWHHKFLTLAFACLAAFFVISPSGKFGYAKKNLVVFNRVPISFFDLYVSPEGKSKPVEDITRKETLDDIFFGFFLTPRDEKILLIVGMGFDQSTFALSDERAVSLEAKGVSLKQMPSRDAIKLYNASVDEHKKVALLLCLRK
jgi:hypothetical protein